VVGRAGEKRKDGDEGARVRRLRGDKGGFGEGRRGAWGCRRPVHYATTRLHVLPRAPLSSTPLHPPGDVSPLRPLSLSLSLLRPILRNNEPRFSGAAENERKVQSGGPAVNESAEQSEKPSIK